MWKERGLSSDSLRPLCRSDKGSISLRPLKQRLFIRGVLMDRNGHPLVPSQYSSLGGILWGHPGLVQNLKGILKVVTVLAYEW